MSHPSPQRLVAALLACALVVHADPAGAAPPQGTLELQINLDGRRYLLNSRQVVVITADEPSDGNTFVVNQTPEVISDTTAIAFDQDVAAYASPRLYAAMDTVTMNLVSGVQSGLSYAFNGVEFVGTGPGYPGQVVISYDAPPSATQPITVGLATRLVGSSVWRPAGQYPLQRYNTRVLPLPGPKLRVFVAGPGVPDGPVAVGLVLPGAVLKPTSPAAGRSLPMAAPSKTSLQLSNYLVVDLGVAEQRTVHFDISRGAFWYGPYSP